MSETEETEKKGREEKKRKRFEEVRKKGEREKASTKTTARE